MTAREAKIDALKITYNLIRNYIDTGAIGEDNEKIDKELEKIASQVALREYKLAEQPPRVNNQ